MAQEITPQSAETPRAALESDMERLAAEIGKSRENPEFKEMGDREIVKQALRAIGSADAPPPPGAQGQASPLLPAYAANAPAGTKLEIEYLVDLALRQGIAKATRQAIKSNPFVLDAYHDALTGKLYPELQKRGLVE